MLTIEIIYDKQFQFLISLSDCRNKTLMFAHMLIERGLPWYTELLRLSLSESRDLKINPRNCIGTVLALNGHRKYFCIYHAKHPETMRGAKVRKQKYYFLFFFSNLTEISMNSLNIFFFFFSD